MAAMPTFEITQELHQLPLPLWQVQERPPNQKAKDSTFWGYDLDLPPTQDSNHHHQHYDIFSRESL